VIDVAEWWGEQTGLPLPLGGNAIRRDLGADRMREVARLLKEAIQYGLDHRDAAIRYAREFGRGLDDELTDRFVGMYVNKWTLDYGDRGREAVRTLLRRAFEAGLTPDAGDIEFIG
jgi:1,4-dihydroxy-6-naphthoate synthase